MLRSLARPARRLHHPGITEHGEQARKTRAKPSGSTENSSLIAHELDELASHQLGEPRQSSVRATTPDIATLGDA